MISRDNAPSWKPWRGFCFCVCFFSAASLRRTSNLLEGSRGRPTSEYGEMQESVAIQVSLPPCPRPLPSEKAGKERVETLKAFLSFQNYVFLLAGRQIPRGIKGKQQSDLKTIKIYLICCLVFVFFLRQKSKSSKKSQERECHWQVVTALTRRWTRYLPDHVTRWRVNKNNIAITV